MDKAMNRRSDLQIQRSSVERGSFGGGYFNPVDDFFCCARPLQPTTKARIREIERIDFLGDSSGSYLIADLFHEMRGLLRSDEVFFAAYEIGRYRVAVHIVDEERLIDFEIRVASREIERLAFYGLQRVNADIGLKRGFDSSV